MNKNKTYPVYFAFGALIVYGALYLLPGLIGIGYSFTDWSSYSTELSFVGLANFKEVLSPDKEYLSYMINTLIFTVVTVICKTCFGLMLAILLTKRIFLRNVHRAIMFMPSVLSLVVVGIVFRSIFNPQNGILNVTLKAVGLDFLALKWLTDPDLALGSVMSVDIWRGTGYIMCIMIAGLMSIPESYYEAAKIDGANSWDCFWHITIPQMMPSLTVTTVLNMIYGLKVFDIVYVLTNGGPGHATEVMYTSVFREYSLGKYAVSTTMSSIMFVVMVFVGYFVVRLMSGKDADE